MKFIIFGLRKEGLKRKLVHRIHIKNIISHIEDILGKADTILDVDIGKQKIICLDISNHNPLPEKFPLYITTGVYVEPVFENTPSPSPISCVSSNSPIEERTFSPLPLSNSPPRLLCQKSIHSEHSDWSSCWKSSPDDNTGSSHSHDVYHLPFQPVILHSQPTYPVSNLRKTLTPNATEYIPISKRISSPKPTFPQFVPQFVNVPSFDFRFNHSPLVNYLIELRNHPNENRETIAELEVELLINH
jgi:hypothetical protein